MDRRRFLERYGVTSLVAGGMAGLAGCSGGGGDGGDGGGGDGGGGDGGGGDGDTTTGGGGDTATGGDGGASSITFRHGGVGTESGNCLTCPDPYGNWTLADRLAEASDDRITMEVVGSGQLCGEGDCFSKIRNGVIEAAQTSIGNSTKFAPENNLWGIGYLLPPRNPVAQSYTVFHPEVWNRYWKPFAEKYNLIPFFGYPGQYRVIHIGKAAAEEFEGDRMTRPEDIEGLKIRRTFSRIPANVIGEWGGNPVEVGWGDTAQGLKSGLVDGLETWLTNVAVFGMIPSIGQTIMNNWGMGYEMAWANAEWLQGLDEQNRRILAEETRRITHDLQGQYGEAVDRNAGATSPPPEGSPYAENDVKVNELSDQDLAAWQDGVAFDQNPELYSKTFTQSAPLLGGGDAGRQFAQFVYDLSRESKVPTDPTNFEIQSWWDDHIDDLDL
jgi:TRAP-type C4-dicarboxylate transport system substrate-binding protein